MFQVFYFFREPILFFLLKPSWSPVQWSLEEISAAMIGKKLFAIWQIGWVETDRQTDRRTDIQTYWQAAPCLSTGVPEEACSFLPPQPLSDLMELRSTAGPGVPPNLVLLQEDELDQGLLQLESLNEWPRFIQQNHLEITSWQRGLTWLVGYGLLHRLSHSV